MAIHLPSESNNPDRGWWFSVGSDDLFGHLSPLAFDERYCPECGAPVEAEASTSVGKDGRFGEPRTLWRCHDCGKVSRAIEEVSFLYPGMVEPDLAVGEVL